MVLLLELDLQLGRGHVAVRTACGVGLQHHQPSHWRGYEFPHISLYVHTYMQHSPHSSGC